MPSDIVPLKCAHACCTRSRKFWIVGLVATHIFTMAFFFFTFAFSARYKYLVQDVSKENFQRLQRHLSPSHATNSCFGGSSSSFIHSETHQHASPPLHLVHVYPRLVPLPNVTAILLSWKRRSNLIPVIRQLERTSWVREVLVWNNNPDLPLTIDFFGECLVSLRVYNSPVNFMDEAKYRACAMATHSVCFYQDDDWDTGHYLEGLWHSFLSEPDYVHSATDSGTAWLNWHWTFFDANLGLHTGHAWIGCGAIFRRALAEEFLQQLYNLHVPFEYRSMADCFFSLWQNRFPRILVQRIIHREASETFSLRGTVSFWLQKVFLLNPEASVAFSAQPGFMERQIKAQIYGIETVRQRLANGERWGSEATQSHWTYGNGFIFLAIVGPVNVLRSLSWPAEYDRGTPFHTIPMQERYLTSGPHSVLEGRCWRGSGSAGFMLTAPRIGRYVTLFTCLPIESMTGMRLWTSQAEGHVHMEWNLSITIEKHSEGRMVFELAQGPIHLVGFLVQPSSDFSGEMSVCGFEIS